MNRPRYAVEIESLEGRRMLAAQAPYHGAPFTAGSSPVTIQAEDYDLGGEGVAYHDTDVRNDGGHYRPGDGVDIMSHGSGLYRIGGPKAGEWIEYTIDVQQPGEYELEFRVSQSASSAQFHAEIDGVDVTGSLVAPNTGSFNTFASVEKTVSLPGGIHVLRLAYDANAANGYAAGFDWIKLSTVQNQEPPPPPPPAQSPYKGTPFAVSGEPVTIQAEDYDLGGEGVAYHDTDVRNDGGHYRPGDGVDIMSHGSGLYRIGGPKAGEWIEYTIDVQQPGEYELEFRVSQTDGGSTFHAEVDAVNVTGSLSAPATGSFNTFTSVKKTVALTAGQHVLRLAYDNAAANGYAAGIDWIKISPVTQPPPPLPQSLVVSTGALTVPEQDQRSFTVKLATAPTSDVTVNISRNTGGDADLTADRATLTFTAANWNVPQAVNIAAAEDVDYTDGQATFTIASTGLTSQSVVATEDDNDVPPPQNLIVSHTGLTVAETSKSLFTVKLAAAPASDVTVTIGTNAGGDPDLRADKATLVFTPANWNVAQQVVISAAADPDTADGSATFTVASSGLSSKSLLATEDDDDTTRQAWTYYVNLNGSDAHAGTAPHHAWQSINKVNAMTFIPGDAVLFRGLQSFNGSIYFDAADSGTDAAGNLIAPITLGSYGGGNATISAGSSFGFFGWNNGGITVQDLSFRGAGPGTNTSDGIALFNNANGNVKQSGITVRNVTVGGFGKNGLSLGGFNGTSGYRNVEITNSQFFENRDGVSLYGPAFDAAAPAYVNENVRVAHVLAYNNHGTSGVTNPTGNGIVFGSVRNGVIERSVAHHNGANNTSRTGPIGIWAYSSDRVTIQHNESYANQRGTGADGGGFDFDENTSNSVMQYNYAHDNDGAGFLLFTGQNNSLHRNNTVRYNVSERDGRASGYGGIVIGGRVSDLDVYNNTIFFPSGSFGTDGAAVFITSIGDRVHVRNNILYTTGGARLISTPDTINELLFHRNVYFTGGGATAIRWGDTVYSSVSGWMSGETEQERVDLDNNGTLDNAALTINPRLTSPGNGGTIGDANNLGSLSAYKLLSDSPLRDVGLDLEARYGIDPGDLDFFGTTIKQGAGFDLGADEF